MDTINRPTGGIENRSQNLAKQRNRLKIARFWRISKVTIKEGQIYQSEEPDDHSHMFTDTESSERGSDEIPSSNSHPASNASMT